MAAAKSLRSRTIPHSMASSPASRPCAGSQVSPVARERARLRNLARKGKQIVGEQAEAGRVNAAGTQVDVVPDTEEQFDEDEPLQPEDFEEPFQSQVEQAHGHMSVRQILDKSKLLDGQFRRNEDILKKLTSRPHSVQLALNDLGINSQVPVPTWDTRSATQKFEDVLAQTDFSALSDSGSGSETTDSPEEVSEEEEETTEAEEGEGESSEGEECNSDPPTAELLHRPLAESQPSNQQADMDNFREITAEEAQAGQNSKAPRQFIPREHVLALVSYYEKVYAAYCKSIAPKKASQLVPNKVWKDVWAAYTVNFPNSTFKEESLKEPWRMQLRDLAKEKDKPNLTPEEDGANPTQDEELLTRLMATESWRAKGVLQERFAVADRVSGESGKKNDTSAKSTPPATPAAGSSMSGQTDTRTGSVGEGGGRRMGTKSQNLKDAKEGINSMLAVMTSMNDEKKVDNNRKCQLAEGKVALHEAKRRESEERSHVLAAQKTALGEQAKMNRIALLKEQKSLGLIDDEQFAKACKVIFYS